MWFKSLSSLKLWKEACKVASDFTQLNFAAFVRYHGLHKCYVRSLPRSAQVFVRYRDLHKCHGIFKAPLGCFLGVPWKWQKTVRWLFPVCYQYEKADCRPGFLQLFWGRQNKQRNEFDYILGPRVCVPDLGLRSLLEEWSLSFISCPVSSLYQTVPCRWAKVWFNTSGWGLRREYASASQLLKSMLNLTIAWAPFKFTQMSYPFKGHLLVWFGKQCSEYNSRLLT